MRRASGLACMVLGLLFLAASLGLLVYNRREDARAGQEAQAALDEIRAAIAAGEPETAAAADADGADGSPAAGTAGGSAEEAAGQDISGLSGEEYLSYIGYLSIPALALELPVAADWSYPALRSAPCRYSGSVEGRDLVIVGHNYSRHFGRLHTLKAGEQVAFTDLSGAVILYEVVQVGNLDPYAVSEAVDGKYALTLLTCTPGGQMRVAVRCTQESGL